jgi:hypothetical protein
MTNRITVFRKIYRLCFILPSYDRDRKPKVGELISEASKGTTIKAYRLDLDPKTKADFNECEVGSFVTC